MTGEGGGGTPLKSTTGQYVVGTRITACYVCVRTRLSRVGRNEKRKSVYT